jgi:methylmalonyl-CoA mutase
MRPVIVHLSGKLAWLGGKGIRAHRAEVKTLAGVYEAPYVGDEGLPRSRKTFHTAEVEGRRAILVANTRRSTIAVPVIATAFADIGSMWTSDPCLKRRKKRRRMLQDNDVHVIGI